MDQGTNSNTSGANVANVGAFPKGFLAKLIVQIGNATAILAAAVKGETKLASLDFMEKAGSDCIPDLRMEEIARRLVVTFEDASQGNISFSPEPPEDKTKLWWQTDPVSNIPIGRVKRWDATTNEWVNVSTPDEPFVAPAKRSGRIFAAAGASTVNFQFESMFTADYKVTLTPTTFNGSVWLPQPGSFPSSYAFAIVNKTEALCSVAFQGMPSGGLYWEIDIEDRQTSA